MQWRGVCRVDSPDASSAVKRSAPGLCTEPSRVNGRKARTLLLDVVFNTLYFKERRTPTLPT